MTKCAVRSRSEFGGARSASVRSASVRSVSVRSVSARAASCQNPRVVGSGCVRWRYIPDMNQETLTWMRVCRTGRSMMHGTSSHPRRADCSSSRTSHRSPAGGCRLGHHRRRREDRGRGPQSGLRPRNRYRSPRWNSACSCRDECAGAAGDGLRPRRIHDLVDAATLFDVRRRHLVRRDPPRHRRSKGPVD